MPPPTSAGLVTSPAFTSPAFTELLGRGELRGREFDGLLFPVQLDEGHDGMQPVGGLMRLSPQSLDEPAYGVTLAGECQQLGRITQCRYGAERTAVPACRRLVDREDPVTGQTDLVGGPSARIQQLGQGAGNTQITHRTPVRLRGQTEQPYGLVVGAQQPVVGAASRSPRLACVRSVVVTAAASTAAASTVTTTTWTTSTCPATLRQHNRCTRWGPECR